jgi:hypothetical protein
MICFLLEHSCNHSGANELNQGGWGGDVVHANPSLQRWQTLPQQDAKPTSFSQSHNLKVNEAKSPGSRQEKINT